MSRLSYWDSSDFLGEFLHTRVKKYLSMAKLVRVWIRTPPPVDQEVCVEYLSPSHPTPTMWTPPLLLGLPGPFNQKNLSPANLNPSLVTPPLFYSIKGRGKEKEEKKSFVPFSTPILWVTRTSPLVDCLTFQKSSPSKCPSNSTTLF